MHSSLIDASIVPLLTTRLLNHHHHHSSATKAKENTVAALLNLFISAHEVLMCTPSILDSLIVTLYLLSPHIVVTLYSFLSIKSIPLHHRVKEAPHRRPHRPPWHP
ncbi:unnamed protein product [Musa acuminata var. zebrina]